MKEPNTVYTDVNWVRAVPTTASVSDTQQLEAQKMF